MIEFKNYKKENMDNSLQLILLGSESCKACLLMKPTVQKVAQENHIDCKYLLVTEYDEVTKILGQLANMISMLPALFFVQRGKPVRYLSGYQQQAKIQEVVSELLV
ncbi:MAG: thioredoxin family protein [Planctomycetaceae bacterium]|nr:thioredoxin family protein [Planctomycetaceae bacterium]